LHRSARHRCRRFRVRLGARPVNELIINRGGPKANEVNYVCFTNLSSKKGGHL